MPGDFSECAEVRFDAERGPRASNIVWVIDTSGSMDEEAALVQDHLNGFAESIVAAGFDDYRVAVVSEASFVTVPDPLGSDATHFLHVEEEVASDEPLSDLLSRFADYSDFLLPDVPTHFVVVTDDESEITAQSFIAEMQAQLAGGFIVHTIASPPGETGGGSDEEEEGDGCVGPHGDAAQPGIENYAAAMMTHGLTFSICTEDWTPLFGELLAKVEGAAPIPCELSIPESTTGEPLDFNLVNVILTSQGASAGNTIPRVPAAQSCSGAGWYYDDPAAPTQMLLCPSSCAIAGEGGTLEIGLGCSTVLN